MQVCQVSASSNLRLNIFFENLHLMWPRQPIKLSNLDKSRMKHGGLLKNISVKKKIQISQ